MYKKKNPKFKVGDKIVSHLRRSNLEKIKVTGTIKALDEGYGRHTYIITGGSVEDFPTRVVKKIK